jgi:DNA (cytosine-5)-methyltransferase 1
MKHKLIDIFSGCGGLSTGFEWAGQFETVLTADIWQTALDTVKLNKPNTETICKPLQDLENQEIQKIKEKYGEIEVVVGGPPCQGFSLAGKRKSDDPRNNLWQEYVRFVSIIKPNWFVLENVFGLASMKNQDGEKVIDLILKEFKKIGYTCEVNLISAKNFNVAQDRKRLLIIGNKNGKYLKLKPVTKTKQKTVREVISDLESLKSGEKSKKDPYHFAMNHNTNHLKWLKPVPEGDTAHNYKHITGMTAKGYSTTYKRIWWDRPSPAITTCFNSISSQNNVHPADTRALTIREAMRIQSFPDNFIFAGNHKDIRTQIGNAVPPELAKQVALQILNFDKNNSILF